MKPGLSFRDLLIHRKEIGSYLGDVDELCDTIAVSLAEGKTMSLVAETSRDHFVQIANVPMAGGGWVVMHEDVTERQQLLKARTARRRPSASKSCSSIRRSRTWCTVSACSTAKAASFFSIVATPR